MENAISEMRELMKEYKKEVKEEGEVEYRKTDAGRKFALIPNIREGVEFSSFTVLYRNSIGIDRLVKKLKYSEFLPVERRRELAIVQLNDIVSVFNLGYEARKDCL